jgi:hypothetical protein
MLTIENNASSNFITIGLPSIWLEQWLRHRRLFCMSNSCDLCPLEGRFLPTKKKAGRRCLSALCRLYLDWYVLCSWLMATLGEGSEGYGWAFLLNVPGIQDSEYITIFSNVHVYKWHKCCKQERIPALQYYVCICSSVYWEGLKSGEQGKSWMMPSWWTQNGTCMV